MEPMLIQCPQCNVEFEVLNADAGAELECPQCGLHLLIPETRDAVAKKEEVPARPLASSRFRGRSKRYWSGRAFILLSRVLALLCLAYIGVRIWYAWRNYRETYASCRFEVSATDRLRVFQHAVVRDYTMTISLLSRKFAGPAARKGLLEGNLQSCIELPDRLKLLKMPFDEELDSVEAVARSQKVLSQVRESLTDVRRIFAAPFDDALRALSERLGNVDDDSSGNSGGRTEAINNQIDEEYPFYTGAIPDKEKALRMLEALFRTADMATLLDSASSLRQVVTYPGFVRSFLLRADFGASALVGGLDERTMRRSGDSTTSSAESTELQLLLLRIRAIRSALLADWRIEHEINQLEQLLQARVEVCEKFNRKLQAARSELYTESFVSLCQGLVAALLIMVFADYLGAHFDMADLAWRRRGEGEK